MSESRREHLLVEEESDARGLKPPESCSSSGRTRACADRFDRHPSTPAFGRSAEKSGPQALGRSRGGLSTKIHLAVDSLGRALRLILTEGQVADIACAQDLVDGLRCKAVIADKGYDSDAFVKSIRASRAKAVIPPRSNRKIQRRYYRSLYRQRNLVERFFNRIKHFRRVEARGGSASRQKPPSNGVMTPPCWMNSIRTDSW
ncbi:ISBm1, transposase orfB, degenerate [Caballeronia pedi]|uniref:ISBm1, transposase orfB, degenerate n=1 Tax=Caballeronia pedi TaxID=1777141 RepID=A0A158C7N8_9BURK|nr:ISBm1, transposase orfB, degenerate [Caballeronia pedi]